MEIESFVLIGGKSTRFGSDKALFKFKGVTLAQRAVDTISQAFPGCEISLVARDEKQLSVADLPAIPIIYDIYKNCGAYGALHAVLSKAASEWIFILACDLPFVSDELLKFLAGFISEELDAVVPVQPDGRVQPLCAFYRAQPCLKKMEQILTCKEKLPPLRCMFEGVKTDFVKFENFKYLAGADDFFLNANHPEDLAQTASKS